LNSVVVVEGVFFELVEEFKGEELPLEGIPIGVLIQVRVFISLAIVPIIVGRSVGELDVCELSEKHVLTDFIEFGLIGDRHPSHCLQIW